MKSPILLTVSSFVFFAASALSSTITVPDATGSVTAFSGTEAGDQSASLTTPPALLPLTAIAQTIDGGAEAVVTGGIDPGAAAAASISSATSSGRVTASASLTYYVEILGPQGVPVNVDVSASISSSSFASATLMAFGQQWSSSEANQSATVVVNTMFSLATGTIYTIELSANAIESCFDLCQTSSDAAAVDPTFTIDNGNPNASDFSIALSENLGSTVPEPGTVGMILVGFSVLLGWRSKYPARPITRYKGRTSGQASGATSRRHDAARNQGFARQVCS